MKLQKYALIYWNFKIRKILKQIYSYSIISNIINSLCKYTKTQSQIYCEKYDSHTPPRYLVCSVKYITPVVCTFMEFLPCIYNCQMKKSYCWIFFLPLIYMMLLNTFCHLLLFFLVYGAAWLTWHASAIKINASMQIKYNISCIKKQYLLKNIYRANESFYLQSYTIQKHVSVHITILTGALNTLC